MRATQLMLRSDRHWPALAARASGFLASLLDIGAALALPAALIRWPTRPLSFIDMFVGNFAVSSTLDESFKLSRGVTLIIGPSCC